MFQSRVVLICCLLSICAAGYARSASKGKAIKLGAIEPVLKQGELFIDQKPNQGPLDLGDLVFTSGIGVIAGSELTYDVSKQTGRFEAWVGITPEVSRKRSVRRSGRFRVYADQVLAFDSGVINQTNKRRGQNPTRPIRVVIPLAKVKQLKLTFECKDEEDPNSLYGGWGQAQFVPKTASEYQIGTYEGKTLAPTPPMGWNSWCRYGTGINEMLIKRVADAMVETGMRDAGYVYLGLDDGWQPKGAMFDVKGNPLWNTEKFPNGMKAVGDYIHAKGLKFGIYSRPAWIKGNETQFATKFAEWGVDLIKYDFSTKEQQKTMLDASRAAGRDVVFSVCEWGRERPWEWAPGLNAEMWRTTYDVKDKWTSEFDNNGGIGILRSAHQNEAIGRFVGPGRWNDLDMLQVGVDGFDYGNDRKKTGFDITPDEEKLQMSLWAILSSPLLASNDVTAMNEHTKKILLNKQVIAIDQDPLGIPGWRVKKLDTIEVWKRPLQNGDLAVAFVNLGDAPCAIDVTWAQLNISGSYKVTNVWAGGKQRKQKNRLNVKDVPSHGVVLVRLSR
jgi:alpha-galactosidase